jgi:hypothetical protein
MRMCGLFGAAIAVSLLTPSAPARADIAPWQLMETDLFRWPDWREILGKYDCTTELEFYLWNAPSPPAPTIPKPPSIFHPAVTGPPGGDPTDPPDPPGGGAGGLPTAPLDPIGTPGGDPPGGAAAVPEPSTWAMLLLGFAGLGYAAFRRSKARISTLAHSYLNPALRRPSSRV